MLDAIQQTTRVVSAAASTNATIAKQGPGFLMGFHGLNAAAAVRFIKFYDKKGLPVVGTDTPVLTIAIPASAAFAIDYANGYQFQNGITFAMTVNGADADTTALTAGDIVGLNVNWL